MLVMLREVASETIGQHEDFFITAFVMFQTYVIFKIVAIWVLRYDFGLCIARVDISYQCKTPYLVFWVFL